MFICRIALRVGTKSYWSKYEPLSDIWFSTEEMGAVQILSVTEIAPKSPFLCVNRSPRRYGSCARQRVSGIVWTPIWYEALYSPRSDPDPEMIPNPEMMPKSIPKWYRSRNDPHFPPRRPRNDPQLILGMESYSVTELLQVCCSVYVLESLQFMWFFSAFVI